MSNDVVVVAERSGGELSDLTFELLGKAKELASGLGGRAGVILVGDTSGLDALGAADVVYTVEHPSLAMYSPEATEEAVAAVLSAHGARLTLLGTSTMGLDLGGALSVRLGAALSSYVVDLSLEGGDLVATSQLYGGKLLAECVLPGEAALATVISGSFPADAGRAGGQPEVVAVAAPASLDAGRTRTLGLREPDRSGVDITAAELLVSVGRGIGGKENLELVQELADALKAPLAASRPVIDQGWLPKPHQVGKSGQKVKPKVYLALGISGAPEHLEGMRSAELIIACNTDPGAPIFDVAHYGTTVDLFDLVPELVEQLEA